MALPNCHLLLMRSKLKSAFVSKIADIASSIRSTKQDHYQKIILSFNEETLDFYGYFYLDAPKSLSLVDPGIFLNEHLKLFSDVQVSRLDIQDAIKGCSEKMNPHNRYVVEMDPEIGWREELFSWYDKEHLPGLASVPGCISAVRCINLDHSPQSFAFYDLTEPKVLGCEAWLKVRNTPWSDQVRPHFTNVKRTMFEYA